MGRCQWFGIFKDEGDGGDLTQRREGAETRRMGLGLAGWDKTGLWIPACAGMTGKGQG